MTVAYIGKSPLALSSGIDADSMAAAIHNKHMSKTSIPNPVFKVTDHTAIIIERGIHKTVFIQRTKLTPVQDTPPSTLNSALNI